MHDKTAKNLLYLIHLPLGGSSDLKGFFLGTYPPVPEVFHISSFIRSTVERGRVEEQLQLPRGVLMEKEGTECLSRGHAKIVE
jgi:hypothetical protein